ncbi:unnamed protein product [Caenorhabditis brenneri]
MAHAMYCPMGSPSLLNGDFSENVARLKDFSWSVIFSSDPESYNKTAPVTSPTVLESFRNATQTFIEAVKIQPVQFLISFVTAFILAFIFSLLISALVTIARRTRKTTVVGSFGAAVFFITLCTWMAFWRLIQDIFTFGLINFFFITFLFVAFEIIRNRSNFRPSQADLNKFRCVPLKIAFIIIAILVFFFSPVARKEHGCPLKIKRLFGEILFWFFFPYLHMTYYSIKLMWTCLTTEEFEMYKDDVYVGRIVKKGDFGWIEHYEEGQLLEPIKVEVA